MSDEILNITMSNYMVCHYCKYIAIGSRMDSSGGWNYGCSKDVKNGEYARIVLGKSSHEEINGFVGCEKFEPSELPAHLTLVTRLIENNPLARNIPTNSDAVETSWDFGNKMVLFPHVECDGSLKVVNP